MPEISPEMTSTHFLRRQGKKKEKLKKGAVVSLSLSYF
jgi:hypothetical protein